MTTYNYNELNRVDGKWQLDKDKMYLKSVFYFNEEGHITKTEEIYVIDEESEEILRTEFKFKRWKTLPRS